MLLQTLLYATDRPRPSIRATIFNPDTDVPPQTERRTQLRRNSEHARHQAAVQQVHSAEIHHLGDDVRIMRMVDPQIQQVGIENGYMLESTNLEPTEDILVPGNGIYLTSNSADKKESLSAATGSNVSDPPQQIPSSVPRTSEREWSTESETESEDSDSSGDIVNDNIGFEWSVPQSQIKVRSPKSTDTFVTEYNESVRPAVVQFLSEWVDNYFVALAVLEEDGKRVTPVVVAFYDSEREDVLPDCELFPGNFGRSAEFVILFGKGKFDFLTGGNPESNRKWSPIIRSGSSIGKGADDNGTAGVFVRSSKNRVYGVTCGHCFPDQPSGQEIQQPWIHDFTRQHQKLTTFKTQLQQLIANTNNERVRNINRSQLEEVDKELLPINQLVGEDENETLNNIKVGRIKSGEFKVVKYRDRQCIADWCIFRISKNREPVETPWVPAYLPEDGLLGSIDWSSGNGNVGELSWDVPIRKEGRASGLTFGFIAGVNAAWRPQRLLSIPKGGVEEFYALEEKGEGINQFAEKGDSGSGVTTANGELVGIIMAKAEMTEVKVIVHPTTGRPDIRAIQQQREKDGSVDADKSWFNMFAGTRFIIMESMKMVLERAKLDGELILDY